MGHYDSCREGYCGCGQTLNKAGECNSRCGRNSVSPVDTPLKGEREDYQMGEEYNCHRGCEAEDYENTKKLSKRRITDPKDVEKDKNDPWVTIVYTDIDKITERFRVEHMRASEALAFVDMASATTKYVILEGKTKEVVRVKPAGYVLETK